MFGFGGPLPTINRNGQSARENLALGMASAQTGNPRDYEEAIFHLQWTLKSQPEPEQEMLAWYWLSRVTEDITLKRDYLENALAVRPTFPDARRDLAILEGRLKPEAMRANPHLSGVGVALAAGGQVAPAQVRRFPCPKCGAAIVYDESYGTVRCQFCGTAVQADGAMDQAAPDPSALSDVGISDQDWVAAIYTDTGHAWALPQGIALKCEGCGATVTMGPAQVSGRCAYCGSPHLVKVAVSSMDQLREPDGVIPFAVGKSGVITSVQAWLTAQGRKIGIPDDLAGLATLNSGIPLYAPFWTFDIEGNVEWSGYIRPDSGINVEAVGGALSLGLAAAGLFTGNPDMAVRGIANFAQDRAENKHLTFGSGWSVVSMVDTLVPATHSLPTGHLEQLEYNTKAAVPYREELLANWPAEVYTISLADASLLARERAMVKVDKDIAMQTGREIKSADGGMPALRVDRTGLTMMSYKLMLLPMWVVTCTGAPYTASL